MDALRNAPPRSSSCGDDNDDHVDPNVITNPLDEAQGRGLEERNAPRRSHPWGLTPHWFPSRIWLQEPGGSRRGRERNGQSRLRSDVIGPPASTEAEVNTRIALRQRHLTPQATTPSEYCTRLDDQLRERSVPKVDRIPVVLLPGDTEVKDDGKF
ncbi:uncharacterized protein IUM83_04808 [Phytophthora cinnamomi]|uniref:uncharacterized protein n=1 Tax=Phytophthora cinnamomi TaxID=4785 RepID=UPI003559DC6E|nr:hypothetical protein IUM83_04808 [Phytophthora cinnamomi]